MIVRRRAPHPHLARLVRFYQARTAPSGQLRRRIVLPARTDVLLEFYFSPPHLLDRYDTLTLERAPAIAVVGPQTFRRVDLILNGAMDIFTVHFTATGLHVLLGVPMAELADSGVDGAALFGSRLMTDLRHRLAETTDFAMRSRVMDDFLMPLSVRRDPSTSHGAITSALSRMKRSTILPVSDLANDAGLSERQFRRLFERQVGVAPKHYARVLRLEAALATKTSTPSRSWTDIAHEVGWFDQAHMDKDFVALTGSAPSHFVAMREQAAMADPY